MFMNMKIYPEDGSEGWAVSFFTEKREMLRGT